MIIASFMASSPIQPVKIYYCLFSAPLQLLSRLQRTLFRLPFKEWRHVGRHRAETTRRRSLPWPQSVGMRGERGQAAGQKETLHRFSSLPRLHDRRGHR